MTVPPLSVASPEAMEALAAELSLLARPGQIILLRGALGAGKSVFARGFIRSLAPAGAGFDIPSPTFTLVQTYDETRLPVAHADLYRLSSPAEADELGLEDLAKSHVLLIEWPERLAAPPGADVLDVHIAGSGTARQVRLTPHGNWLAALARSKAIASFLRTTAWAGATRHFLEGDASFRRYEVLEGGGAPRAILMDMAARPDGPPVKNGKPYSAIAHLAEDIGAVIAINSHLHGLGYSAPAVFARDLASGLAVIEDLGDRVYGRMRLAGEDMTEPMGAAVAVLADMAGGTWPASVPVSDGRQHVVPPYDREAQLIEIDLLPSWFWPYLHGVDVPANIAQAFHEAWEQVLPFAAAEPPVWTLRDFHSPNLLWLPERQGVRRVGLIDTQDCVRGHPAYDLASLLQDARVDIAAEEERQLFDHYQELRRHEAHFDAAGFAAAYAILGAQRATKILGIFARLSKRDGKHGYLRHMPRVSGYLERNLAHPALAPVRAWYQTHLPPAARDRRP
jgi:tRNA threonylcarbamoyl adenosine modification protein YjeE